jgi:hypothetical protein
VMTARMTKVYQIAAGVALGYIAFLVVWVR